MMITTMLLKPFLAVSLLIVGGPWDPDNQDASTKIVRATHLESAQGKLEEAVALYRQVLATPDVPAELATRARLELANCLVKMGELEATPVPAPERIVPTQPNSPPRGASTVIEVPLVSPEAAELIVPFDDYELPRGTPAAFEPQMPTGVIVSTAPSAESPELPEPATAPGLLPAPAQPADPGTSLLRRGILNRIRLTEPELPVEPKAPGFEWDEMIDSIIVTSLKKVDREMIEKAMLDGVAELLGRHSRYFTPKELESFRFSMGSELVGIGALLELADEGDSLLIKSTVPGSSAEAAKLQGGDKIVSVDGKTLAEIGGELTDYVHEIRGSEGSKVLLGIIGGDDGERFDLSITRTPIALKETTMIAPVYESDSGKPVFMVDEQAKIGAFRLRSFPVGLADKLAETIMELTEQGIQALVIDLRGNGGGSLSESIQAAQMFIGDALVVKTLSFDGVSQEHRGKSTGWIGEAMPVVLLVDELTASSAEIFAAALQDHNRAMVMGSRTFGKGTVETLVPISNGGAMKLTTSEYFRPSGKAMKRPENDPEAEKDPNWGVRPTKGWDIVPAQLPRDLDDRERFDQDPVWRTAMDYLKKKQSKTADQ